MSHNKQKLTLAFWITLVSFVSLTTAAYAWMSIASTMKVTDLALNVVTENALELAPDINGEAGEWTTILQMPELLAGDVVLKPATYSAQRDAFLTPRYGLDGRADFSDPIRIINAQLHNPTPSSASSEAEEGAGYLFAFDFWVRTGASNCVIYLSEPKDVSQGLPGGGSYVVGRPIWNPDAVKHEDGGKGAQNALRIAFRCYDEPDGSTGKFVIFEPNADSGDSYEPTPSVDGTGTLIDGDSLILQSASGWSEQSPVLRDHVDYRMGSFIGENVGVFSLKAGHPRRVTLYIWLEGQDKDCNNTVSAADILVNLQLTAVMGSEENDIVPR